MRPAGGLDLDQRLQKDHAARAGADDFDRRAARLSLRSDFCRDLIGAEGQRRGILRNENPGHPRTASRASARLSASSRPIDLVVEQRGRRTGAKAEAINRLDGQFAIGRRAMPIDAELGEKVLGQRLASHALAGFAAAKLQDMAAGGLAAEIMVECNNAVHFGAAEVQRFGDERRGGLVDMAELMLQGMKNRQHGPFETGMLADDRLGARGIPRSRLMHIFHPTIDLL